MKKFLGLGENPVVDQVFGGASRVGFYLSAEISSGEAALIGEVCDRRQPVLFRLSVEIFIQQMKKLLHYAVIDLFTGDELAVVEAKAIIEQKLNVGNYQFTGVFVDGAVQFLLYHGKYTPEDFNFLGG